MTESIVRYLVMAIAFIGWSALISWHWYGVGVKNGTNSERAQCQSGLNSLQQAINKANSEASRLSESQKDSYRLALEIRNKSVKEIESELNEKVAEIEELKNETANTCVNAPIPDRFK